MDERDIPCHGMPKIEEEPILPLWLKRLVNKIKEKLTQ